MVPKSETSLFQGSYQGRVPLWDRLLRRIGIKTKRVRLMESQCEKFAYLMIFKLLTSETPVTITINRNDAPHVYIENMVERYVELSRLVKRKPVLKLIYPDGSKEDSTPCGIAQRSTEWDQIKFCI